MSTDTADSSAISQSAPLIIEVEGYDGDDGEIVVNNYRSANDPPFGTVDRIYCIGEMGSDGVIRFNDWGYATAQEARDALRWRTKPASEQSDALGPSDGIR